MGEAEAQDEFGAVAIADVSPFIWAELHHAERDASAGKILAIVAGADEGIDIVNGLLGAKRLKTNTENRQNGKDPAAEIRFSEHKISLELLFFYLYGVTE